MANTEQMLSAISPLPFISKSGAHSGNLLMESSCCKNCEKRSCIINNNITSNHNICDFGMSYRIINFLGERFCLVGYIDINKNNKVGGDRRKALSRLWATEEQVVKVIQNINNAEVTLKNMLQSATGETTSFLHDVRTSLSLVMSSCERLISSRNGNNFAEKLREADPDLLRLYQSIGLLTEQLGLVDILSNPESITYGNKSKSDIYQFFHKMVKLFQPRAWDRKMDIRFEGNIFDNVELYSSFQLVPLVLLDNAVKYGNPGSKIFVKYDHKEDGLYVDFLSYGVLIPTTHEELVFKRGIRGPNAHEQSNTGSGLGLYIASEVVKAHGFHISYSAREPNHGDGWNCFTLFIDESYLL